MDDKPDFLKLESDTESEPTPGPTADITAENETGQAIVTFRGNSYDLSAVVGVTIGGIMLSICVTCGIAQYIIPLIPIVLGIVGLVAAKESVDPERTKLLSWISLGSGALFLVLIFLCVIAYVVFIMSAIATDSGGF